MQSFEEEEDKSAEGTMVATVRPGAPQWMVTYADLMSLLFALFVLILSFSVIDDNSFERNAGPMREAFNQNADFAADQQSFQSGGRGILQGVQTLNLTAPDSQIIRENLIANLRETLARDLNNNLVELEETNNGVIMRFPSNTAFGSGGAELSRDAEQSLRKIIPVLSKTPGEIKVGGHTDDVPISTLQYRSNWDLSSARATSVIHFFIRSGEIDKKRLTSQGYADSRPLVPNDNAENRSKNRRVEISVEIPEDTTGAEEFLENLQPRQRIWTTGEGEREINENTEPVSRSYERGLTDERGVPIQEHLDDPKSQTTEGQTDQSMADELNKRSRDQFNERMRLLAQ